MTMFCLVKQTTRFAVFSIAVTSIAGGARGSGGVVVTDAKYEWMLGSGVSVDFWSRTGTIRPVRPITSDYFSATTFSPSWKWEGIGTDDRSQSIMPGYLRIKTHPGSLWWDAIDTAPKVYQVTGSDFAVTTKISDTRACYSQAFSGLFIRQDPLNFIAVGITKSGTGCDVVHPTHHVIQSVNGTTSEYDVSAYHHYYRDCDTTGDCNSWEYPNGWVQLKKTGSKVEVVIDYTGGTCWASCCGPVCDIHNYWTEMTLYGISYDHYEVGLISNDTTVSSSVFFDYMEASYSAPVSDLATYTSTPFDMGVEPPLEGRISWSEDRPAGTFIFVKTQTSADGVVWEAASPAYASPGGSTITSTKQRYIRFTIEMNATATATPYVDWVRIAYPTMATVRITSPTHPENAVTRSPNPVFSLSLSNPDSATVVGYRYLLDKTPHSQPTVSDSITTDPALSIPGLGNATWYLHVRAQHAEGPLSETSTYAFTVNYTGAPLVEADIHAIPSPVRGGRGTIQYELAVPVQKLTIEILNEAGRIVEEKVASTGQGVHRLSWDTSGLANGVYILRFRVRQQDGKEKVVHKKVGVVR